MKVASPHYLLFSESCRQDEQGQWRFVLQSLDGKQQFEAADVEPDAEIPGYGPVAELLEKTGREGVTLRDDIELELR